MGKTDGRIIPPVNEVFEAVTPSKQSPTSPKRKRRELLLVGFCPIALRNEESVIWLTVLRMDGRFSKEGS